MEQKGEVILYQPEEAVKLEVRLEDETVWLTQEQIATLFGTKRPAITKHLSNIYSSGELDRESTCSILEHMGNDGKQKYVTKFYNLDVILSVGYRVNSRNATLFRRWANSVLKEYLLKGYSINRRLAQAITDASFGMFLSMLEYKCHWYGVNLVRIDRFAPSSKTCGECGHVYRGLKLSDRSWTCPGCGTHLDRDLNAARNIKEFSLKALPREPGEVKPVDCPTVDDRPRVLKSRGRKKQEKKAGDSLQSSCLEA